MYNPFYNAFHIYKYWHNENKSFSTGAAHRAHSFRSVEEGKLTAVYQGKSVTVNKGELLYIPAEKNVDIKVFAEPNCHGMVFNLRYFPDVDEIDYPVQAIKINDEIMALINELPPTKTTKVSSAVIWKVYKLISLIQERMVKNTDKRAEKIEKALVFMRKNDIYSVPELAEYCEMSERRFYAAFKELTGITPTKMKAKLQVIKAEPLLKNTELTTEQIAKEVGFESVAYFRKLFHQRFSMSPGKYRKMKRK